MLRAHHAISQYGVKSEAARQIVTWIYSADLMCPYDRRSLMQLLLTPTQFLLWELVWTQRATEEAMRHPDQRDPYYGMTAEMLTGQGAYADPDAQAAFPASLLQLSARLALDAFLALPGSAAPAFAAVVQGAAEGYGSFIDRLRDAVMSHPDWNEESKQQMFRALAFDNANPTTKQILGRLPMGAGVEEMLATAERAAARKQRAAVAAAVQDALREVIRPLAAAVQQTGAGRARQPSRGRCYRCGQAGHTRRNCRGAVWCDSCQKATHATEACSGTGGRSAERGHAQREMNPPGKARVFRSGVRPHPEAAWESPRRPQ